MQYFDVKTNEKREFTIKKSIFMSEKVTFIKYVSEMVVSENLGYMLVLKDLFFDHAILEHYTDIVVFENEDDFGIDMLEEFIKANKDVINMIKEEIGVDEVRFLKTCCNELIKFRRVHFGEYKTDIAELLNIVRELVVKPDYAGELLKAVTEWINTNAVKTIDFDVLSKFADVIPVMNNMNNSDVAKAILRDFRAEDAM